MPQSTDYFSPEIIADLARRTLEEDLGSGDIHTQLIPLRAAQAQVLVRENAVLCGRDLFEACFLQLDNRVRFNWHADEGADMQANQLVVEIAASNHALLSGERSALNFLQLMSGTASTVRRWSMLLTGSCARLLDTRKTLPGLRLVQKYAAHIGGCANHRLGLYDAFLLKENHIAAHGSMAKLIQAARNAHPDKVLEVEVENLAQLEQALDAGADWVMLDNFSPEVCAKAVDITAGRAKLEASGNIGEDNLSAYAQSGVDYISVGALTKDVTAIDYSLRLEK